MHSAGDDPLAIDADLLEQRAQAAGTAIVHRRHPGMWHAFHALAGLIREADEGTGAFVAALDRAAAAHTDRAGT